MVFYKKLKVLMRVLNEKKTELLDSVLLKFNFYDSAIKYDKPGSKKRIVFVGQQLTHRIIKIIQWLKIHSDFEIIVVSQDAFFRGDLLPNNYDRLVLFKNRSHLKRIILGSNLIDVIYAFSSNPKHAAIAIEFCTARTIFDPYDCNIIYYGKNDVPESQQIYVEKERMCFKLANAMVARSTENNAAYKIYGIEKKKTIFFSDYCDNNLFTFQNVALSKADEITIVYAGSLKGKAQNQISDGMTDFSSFIEAIESQKIHFHIYPSQFVKKADYQEYLDTEKKVNYLHIHSTLSQGNLSHELSGYHFGTLPQFKTENSTLSDYKIERGTALKFFNFLEAGLPILISDEWKYMAWLVRRYKIGIVFGKEDFSNLRNIILSVDYAELKNNVLAFREKNSMQNNTPRLIKFIASL